MALFGDLDDVTRFPPVAEREFEFVEHIFFESKCRGRPGHWVGELINKPGRLLVGFRGLNKPAAKTLAIRVDPQMFE